MWVTRGIMRYHSWLGVGQVSGQDPKIFRVKTGSPDGKRIHWVVDSVILLAKVPGPGKGTLAEGNDSRTVIPGLLGLR